MVPIAVRGVHPRRLSPYRTLIGPCLGGSGACPSFLQGLLDTVRLCPGSHTQEGLCWRTMARPAQAAACPVFTLVAVVIASQWEVFC